MLDRSRRQRRCRLVARFAPTDGRHRSEARIRVALQFDLMLSAPNALMNACRLRSEEPRKSSMLSRAAETVYRGAKVLAAPACSRIDRRMFAFHRRIPMRHLVRIGARRPTAHALAVLIICLA